MRAPGGFGRKWAPRDEGRLAASLESLQKTFFGKACRECRYFSIPGAVAEWTPRTPDWSSTWLHGGRLMGVRSSGGLLEWGVHSSEGST